MLAGALSTEEFVELAAYLLLFLVFCLFTSYRLIKDTKDCEPFKGADDEHPFTKK